MKKFLIFIISIIVIGVILSFSLRHFNHFVDRLNPLEPRTKSYAKVPHTIQEEMKKLSDKALMNLQDYRNINIYDEKGIERTYHLDFEGHDPLGTYVVIDHKGLWVFSIEYIDKHTFKHQTGKE
ncbi:hypothetical protein [Staphylococcus massiliensis]|uniref:Uncharacterized protein n=1 Tax=Staphylococcus massiliensis S46 TaxID=1229783 RepID=K9B567_9STAP|nr:hypothetical protein [Staphylococcus massiliensis]EKU49952.1 hypothetical protein C273_03620 [Staphylococcus massiliensis S46]MCG3400946.1 hypothetical protein [Staphylococcus massiliensis]POA01783.1 hypothetical protein CD133_00850 [Staphylococcus massiliensis CCUG 55927]